MKFGAERGHVVQMKTGMVRMGGLGSSVNYKELEHPRSASFREEAHLAVPESLSLTSLLLQLRWVLLCQP